ncbi:hypothetical protein M3P36_13275 [Altererythrobacter sp. KTW20L]|uniref:hypothetical protein n=1 Tax=Altererythrobacter sp. KTW20L TaxID=2942210 RepID=UPI0020C1564E|nr:hypothetical protein [Altererythrobacter sp. KTW20L]MCL6252011.1 hypothetical protein [Altererythrobacter sp. KTW20L]
MTEYLILFALVFGINLLPAFGPPTAAILVLYGLNSDLPLMGLVPVAALAAASGRYVLAHGFRFFARYVSEKTRANLAAARAAFERKKHSGLAALALFAVSPLPSAQLFAAVGLTGVRILPFTLAFFSGRLVSYTFYAGSAGLVAEHTSVGHVFQDSLTSPLGVALQVAMLAMLVALMKVDWAKVFGSGEGRD